MDPWQQFHVLMEIILCTNGNHPWIPELIRRYGSKGCGNCNLNWSDYFHKIHGVFEFLPYSGHFFSVYENISTADYDTFSFFLQCTFWDDHANWGWWHIIDFVYRFGTSWAICCCQILVLEGSNPNILKQNWSSIVMATSRQLICQRLS